VSRHVVPHGNIILTSSNKCRFIFHLRWLAKICHGYRARLGCGRSWVRVISQVKATGCKIGICCFSNRLLDYYKIISISRPILARANMGFNFVSGQYGCLFSRCRKYVINSLIHGHFHIGPCINLYLSSWYITCKTWTNSIHVYRTQKTKTEEQNQTENRNANFISILAIP
jgi:hypothetical protein